MHRYITNIGRPTGRAARRGQKMPQPTWGEIVLEAVLGILLILFLFASIMFKDWIQNKGGGAKLDTRWRRYRQTRRARDRT